MKKTLIPALAATLLLAGWQTATAAPAPAPAPEIYYGAKNKHATADEEEADSDADADADDSKSKGKKGKKDKKEKKDVKLGEAAKAFKGVKFFNGKPNLKAKFFIYFQASAENLHSSNMMQDIVTEYKKMKKEGVEIIYVGHDPSAAAAKKLLHQNKAKFPGILKDEQDVQTFPGFAPSTTLPNVIIINADGEVVHKGDGATITTGEWKGKTVDAESKD